MAFSMAWQMLSEERPAPHAGGFIECSKIDGAWRRKYRAGMVAGTTRLEI